MSGILHSSDGLSQAEALTSAHPQVSCLARMAASDFADRMLAFINAEMDRGTNPATLLVAMSRFYVQTHSSLAAQVLRPGGEKTAADGFIAIIKEDYLEHAERSRQHKAEGII